jgi:hypothetical protein
MQISRPLIIHHANCLDGIAAAWCFWDRFDQDVDLLPAQYGDAPPPAEMIDGREVYIVDFSYEPEELVLLAGLATQVHVFDHHESAVRKLDVYQEANALPDNLKLTLDTTKAGCILAWNYLYPPADSIIPDILLAIADRDLWLFELEDTRAICAALYSYTPTVQLLAIHIDDPMGAMVLKAEGEPLLRQQANQIQQLIEKGLIGIELGGYYIPAINAPMFLASELGATILLKESLAPYVAIYQREEHKWKFSLRGRKGEVNVAKIAESYGGGGHPAAAGFYLSPKQFAELMI